MTTEGKHTKGLAYLAEDEIIVSRDPLVLGKAPVRENSGAFIIMLRCGPTDDDVIRLGTADRVAQAKKSEAYRAPDPEGLANAERMVLCWNAHDALVEALEGFLLELDTAPPVELMSRIAARIPAARAALNSSRPKG